MQAVTGGLKYIGDFVVQVRTHLLTSDFGSSTRGERQFLKVFHNHTTLTTSFNSWNLTLCPNGRNSTIILHGLTTSQHYGRTQLLNTMVGTQLLHTMVGTQLNLFQNLPNSQPISTKQDVIHSPDPFPVWGLLWQWWLSYPLCTIVKCTNWLHTWTLNPNSSKPSQIEW